MVSLSRYLITAGFLMLASLASAAVEVTLTAPAGAETDCVPMVREAFERLGKAGGKLHFAPGTYHFFPDRAFEKYTNVSNHESGLRRAAFPILERDGLEVDGGGATFVMHGLIVPFLIEHSRGVTVRNVTVDWAQPFNLQGTVVAVDAAAQTFELEVLPQSHAMLERGKFVYGACEVPGPRGWRFGLDLNYWMDPVTHAAAAVAPGVSMWNTKLNRAAEITQVGPNRFRLAYATTGTPALGTLLVSKGNPNRFAPAFVVSHDRDVVLEDVTVHHASGMAVIGQRSENITLRRLHVTPSPTLGVAVSVIADATHFVSCRGDILVEDCRFEAMLDDAINVHAINGIVAERVGANAIGMRLNHYQQMGFDFAEPGDVLSFCRRETLLDYGERTVKRVERVNEEYSIIEFVQPLDGFLQPESRVENVSWKANLTFRRNLVSRNRARSVLYTARGKAVIEGNTFDRSSGTIILIEGDAYSWHEAGPVSDVTIRDNTFIGLNARAPLIQISPRQPDESRLQPPYHHNITITGNRFQAVHPFVLNVNRAANLRFENNVIEMQPTAKAVTAGESLHFRASENVVIARNRFSLPKPATIVAEGCRDLHVSENTGLAEAVANR